MPPANLLERFNNYIYKKFSNDMGASLIVLGVAGWTFSALGQLGMIALNKNIDKKEKKFLIPQEIADGVVNVTLFYTICAGIKKAVDSLLESGKILTFRTNNLVKEFRAGQSSVEDLIKAARIKTPVNVPATIFPIVLAVETALVSSSAFLL